MRKFILLVAMLNLSGMLFSQLSRQQIFEQQKEMIADKSRQLIQSNTKPYSRLLNSNQSLCEFTVDSVHAVNNPLGQIIQSLVGSGISISNIQTNLPPGFTMYGSFSCGSAAKLGIESGLVLTTGSVDSVKGPNKATATTGEHSLLPGFPNTGYPPLDAIANGTGYDAVWVSFDIVSTTDSIKFDYVFGSE